MWAPNWFQLTVLEKIQQLGYWGNLVMVQTRRRMFYNVRTNSWRDEIWPTVFKDYKIENQNFVLSKLIFILKVFCFIVLAFPVAVGYTAFALACGFMFGFWKGKFKVQISNRNCHPFRHENSSEGNFEQEKSYFDASRIYTFQEFSLLLLGPVLLVVVSATHSAATLEENGSLKW